MARTSATTSAASSASRAHMGPERSDQASFDHPAWSSSEPVESAIAGSPAIHPSAAAPTVPLESRKARPWLKPTLMPETTISGRSSKRACTPSWVQSAGCPLTAATSTPPRVTRSTATSAWRVMALPIQLSSPAGATARTGASPESACTSAGRAGESTPSSFVTSRKDTRRRRTGARRAQPAS
ncbi:MAG: hypothetical protein R3263_07110, partial [Myxococcota bacterium]|nr:hypothetical protein [Myxococcota bacterium]